MPALRHIGVGAKQKAVGKLDEQCAPFRVQLAAGHMVGAKREVAPRVLVLAQHVAHLARALESGMRPQDARCGILPEQSLDGVDIGVRMQVQPVFPRELHQPSRNRQVGIRAVEVEFADRGVAIFFEPLVEITDDRVVAHPRADVAARAVRAQRRHDEVRGFCVQLLVAVVIRTRYQRAFYAGFA